MPSRSLLHIPNLFTRREEQKEKWRQPLMLYKLCSTLVCYQCYFGHKSKPQHHTSCYDENYLHLGQTQNSWIYIGPWDWMEYIKWC